MKWAFYCGPFGKQDLLESEFGCSSVQKMIYGLCHPGVLFCFYSFWPFARCFDPKPS